MSEVSTTGTGPPVTIGGRYTLGDLIGRGGAADVYRAHDELLGRDVAVKMFTTGGEVVAEAQANGVSPPGPDAAPVDPAPIDPAESSDHRHRREVLTLAGLSHPGLVTVYDVGAEDGRAYFVMQLIEGDTLAQRIRAGALSVADVVTLGAALADALAYVHRRGVVHRDVKPGNVLLDAEGRAHLSDFGIAAVHDAAPVTAAGMVIGTASYLSPEQVRGEPVGAGVDVYALGLVLVECLTGRREYPGNALEAAVARLHRRPSIPRGLPGNLAELLDAMTADEPGDRPTAEGVVAALRAISREVGMDAQTVLSPVLMTAPTAFVGPPSAPSGSGPMVAPGWPTGETAAVTPHPPTSPPAPAPTRRPRHRRALTAAVVVLAALLLGGSAVGYAMLAEHARTARPAVATVAPGPPPPSVGPAPSSGAPDGSTGGSPGGSDSTGGSGRVVPTQPRARAPQPVAPSLRPVAPVAPPPPVATVRPTTTPTSPRSGPTSTTGRPTSTTPPTTTTSK